MDVLHVALGAVLWLSMVGMALGCERIRGRPRAAETPVAETGIGYRLVR
jgi:hypothetical protein